MPIKRELRGFYPIDWTELSRSIRFRRAKGRCEHCARPHGALICHLGDGRWFDEEVERWRDEKGRLVRSNLGVPADLPSEFSPRRTKVVLACAHLNHDVADNSAANLAALCQRCHLLHDREEHRIRRRLTWRAKRAVGDLFHGRYR